MSRWIEALKTHPYKASWERAKVEISSTAIEDQSVTTSVSEIGRLKKASAYIDQILKGLDPELVPLNTFDQFNAQAGPCADQVAQFNATKNIGHIHNANQHLDNLLTYVRPYMIVKGKLGKALQEAAVAYSDVVTEYSAGFASDGTRLLSEITKDREQAGSQLNSIKSMGAEIEAKHSLLIDGADGSEGIFFDLEKKYNEIVAYQARLIIGTEEVPSIKSQVTLARDVIVEVKGKIEDLFTKVDGSVKELNVFHAKVFGPKGEDEARTGLAAELDERMMELSDFEKNQQSKYETLNSQIESLLPGATSAGLASAYKEMKDSFEKPIKHASLVFYVSIAALVFVSFALTIEALSWSSISFIDAEDWQDVLRSLAKKVPFYGPVLWLAFYATKRRSEYQRLQQEYAHKEALAKSYDSYRKQIEGLDSEDSEMLKDLLVKAVDAIAHNASSTLDGKHGDKMPSQEMVEKMVVLLMAEAKRREVT